MIDPSSKLRISSISIANVGRFENFDLSFNDKVNIICGTNGIGKTTILQLISASFARGSQSSYIARRALSESSGSWQISVYDNDALRSTSIQAENPPPIPAHFLSNLHGLANRILFFPSRRDIPYSTAQAVTRDPPTEDHRFLSQSLEGIASDDIKRWLINRNMFRSIVEALPPYKIRNLDVASSFFSVVDPSVKFSNIDASTFDLLVNTKDGKIPFEFLSSGFRSSLALLIGIINEIEVRGFQDTADKFSGVILIDEVDLHLHPSWQTKIIQILRSSFPNAQFIVTTHSPHVVQNAGPGEVIALRLDGEGNTLRATLTESSQAYKGWTIEEILTDVMGLDDAVSDSYKRAVADFYTALDAEDGERVHETLGLLQSMLHPSNEMHKLFKMQASPFLVEKND